MKKFYSIAEAGTAPGGHTVRLDGKTIKTPLQHPFIVPTAKLAAALAAEWAAQENEVVPASMPLNLLANTMIDKAHGHERRAMEQALIDYGASDLVCYMALNPEELVTLQESHWQPLIDWMKEAHGIVLEPVRGIQYHHQPAESLNKIALLVEGLDPATFTATQAAAGATGSLVIGLALAQGRLTAGSAFDAACVDELYQLEKWGDDALARKRLDTILADLQAVETFYRLLRP
jgi:chaperone required for assembly of F1-ATPase